MSWAAEPSRLPAAAAPMSGALDDWKDLAGWGFTRKPSGASQWRVWRRLWIEEPRREKRPGVQLGRRTLLAACGSCPREWGAKELEEIQRVGGSPENPPGPLNGARGADFGLRGPGVRLDRRLRRVGVARAEGARPMSAGGWHSAEH